MIVVNDILWFSLLIYVLTMLVIYNRWKKLDTNAKVDWVCVFAVSGIIIIAVTTIALTSRIFNMGITMSGDFFTNLETMALVSVIYGSFPVGIPFMTFRIISNIGEEDKEENE